MISTAVAVDTDVLGDVHAAAGLTKPIGVSGSTLSLVSENAQVVTAEVPRAAGRRHTNGRYQAVAYKGPELGTVNFAVSVAMRVVCTSQNMNS